MARTAITPTPLTGNGVSTPVAVSIDISNGMAITAASPEMTTLLITNTDTNPHTVTLRGGDPVMTAAGGFDQPFSIPASSSRYIGPFTSSRCEQKDGSMWLDFVSGHTGTVTALVTPRGI
jgi:hypothetical protein